MKALSFLFPRLDICGICLITLLATACSFDASQLRALASPAPDGAIEYPAVPEAGASGSDGTRSNSPDAITGADGGGGGDTGGSGGSVDAGGVVVDGSASFGDAAALPDLGTARDVPTPADWAQPGDAGADAPLVVDATSIPDATSVSTLGLVLYYNCDQVNGTSLPDMSGKGNNGTLVGSISIAPGKVGNALVLANNTDAAVSGSYVAMPPAILATARDMTVATWFKINSTPSFQRIFEIGNSSATSSMYLTPTYTDGYPRFTIRTALTDAGLYREDITATGITVPTGVWAHLAVVLDVSGGRLYLNGVQVGTNTTMKMRPADLGATPNDWIGGSEFTGTPFLDGAIDEFRVYNRALSAAEILALVGPVIGACPTGYHDGGAGTCVISGTCSPGYHDGGGGTCVVVGTCSTGYHDNGVGTCVVVGTCSTGYHNGGTGTCVASGTCSTGCHDGGTGTCVVSGTCSIGYHDGGNRTCVVSGTCWVGYNNCSGTCSSSSCGGGLGADCSSQPCASGLTCRTDIYGGRVCSSG